MPNLDGITARDRWPRGPRIDRRTLSSRESPRERAVMNGDARPAMPGR
jgi:hypothetical protein